MSDKQWTGSVGGRSRMPPEAGSCDLRAVPGGAASTARGRSSVSSLFSSLLKVGPCPPDCPPCVKAWVCLLGDREIAAGDALPWRCGGTATSPSRLLVDSPELLPTQPTCGSGEGTPALGWGWSALPSGGRRSETRVRRQVVLGPGLMEQGTEAPGGRGRGALGWFPGRCGVLGAFPPLPSKQSGGPEGRWGGFPVRVLVPKS